MGPLVVFQLPAWPLALGKWGPVSEIHMPTSKPAFSTSHTVEITCLIMCFISNFEIHV